MKILIMALIPFIVIFTCIPIISPIAKTIGLVDIPNSRKIHQGNIPLVGGISIFIGVFISGSIFLNINVKSISFLASILLLIITGALDDRFDLKVSIRMFIQLVSAIILMGGGHLYLENLGNLFNFGIVHIGTAGIVITILGIIGAINAYNMIDGVDGLAGSISLTNFISLAILFYIQNNIWFVLPIIFSGAIFAFLLFNLDRPFKKLPKVFMGDAGSMLIGISIVWLLMIGTQSKQRIFDPAIALWIIAIPLIDMVCTMIRRIIKGDSPFKPDRTHLHHLLIKLGFSNKKTLIIITSLSLLTSFYAVFGKIFGVSEFLSLCLFLTLFISYYLITNLAWNRVNKKHRISKEGLAIN